MGDVIAPGIVVQAPPLTLNCQIRLSPVNASSVKVTGAPEMFGEAGVIPQPAAELAVTVPIVGLVILTSTNTLCVAVTPQLSVIKTLYVVGASGTAVTVAALLVINPAVAAGTPLQRKVKGAPPPVLTDDNVQGRPGQTRAEGVIPPVILIV